MPICTDDFCYNLPDELIAQYPAQKRNESRMLVMERESGKCEIRKFSDISDYLNSGDCVVFNNTKVMNARMYGEKKDTGAKIEILLISQIDKEANLWESLVRPGKRVKISSVVYLKTKDDILGNDFFTIKEKTEDGHYVIEFSITDMEHIFAKYGHVPLPPYIKRDDVANDFERYQTVYAKSKGAVAAPTAGLHFSEEIIENIRAKGVTTQELTLHVGPGTFKPVSVANPADHKMHTESYEISDKVANIINETHKKHGKVMAVGTTTVRVIETLADESGIVHSGSGDTDIFLYPPYQPRAIDMLLTNFHLPKSTLLMLVSTFSQREYVLNAYELAIKEKFKFYSYGDCMLLI